MASVGDLFKTEPVEWRGRTLALPRPSFATEAAYRDYLEKQALAAVRRSAPDLSPPEYQAMLAQWQRDCACKVYEFGGPEWARSLQSAENAARFFYVCLTQAGLDGAPSPNLPLTLPEMDELWKEKGSEIAAAWERLNAPADPPKPATVARAPAA